MSETGIPTPTYSSFLAATLRELYWLSSYGDPVEFLRATKSFFAFLPPEVKELIRPKMEEVDEEVINVMKTTHDPAGSHYTRVKRKNALNRVCRIMVTPLIGEIVDVLHARGWIEKRFTRSGPELLKPLYEGEETRKEEEEEEEE